MGLAPKISVTVRLTLNICTGEVIAGPSGSHERCGASLDVIHLSFDSVHRHQHVAANAWVVERVTQRVTGTSQRILLSNGVHFIPILNLILLHFFFFSFSTSSSSFLPSTTPLAKPMTSRSFLLREPPLEAPRIVLTGDPLRFSC